jgi:hypothetical protein
MTLKDDIQPLLDQYQRFNGRGNLTSANLSLVMIIEKLVAAIDRDHLDMRKLAPEGVEDPDMMVDVDTLVAQIPKPVLQTAAILSQPVKRGRGRPRKVR